MRRLPLAALVLASVGCSEKTLDASEGEFGDPCVFSEFAAPPVAAEAEGRCAEAWVCAPSVDIDGDGQDDAVCVAPAEIAGRVVDAVTQAPLAGALVAALDGSGAPVSLVASTDADGRYRLHVRTLRDADGLPLAGQRYTLFASAAGHRPFPSELRPALPLELSATGLTEHAGTDVALWPLAAGEGGHHVSGTVNASAPAGTLVVAEGTGAYTIADAAGAFTLFDVPAGAVTVTGYRRDLALAPAMLDVQGDLSGVVLHASDVALASVSGSVNIVDAPGGSRTSVVLVPSSVYDEAFERGPVPWGLRAPMPPELPSVTSAFTIDGVPPGRYRVLAAFENDGLVRDPDPTIAGTSIPEIEVASAPVVVDVGFKVTGALAVVSPGAESPEVVTAPFDLVWADDASEDAYAVVVFDALGTAVWTTEVDRGVGSPEVRLPYDGPSLVPGNYYQFRATSLKNAGDTPTPLSRTEDLRGIFVFAG